MRAAVFPDSEGIATSWLRGRDDLAARASTDLVGWRAGERRVVITRSGGVPSLAIRIDNPRLDVDCYAESKEAAHDLAQAARAALHELPAGDFRALGAVVADVRDDSGIAFVPDPDTGSARYVFALRLAVRPHP